MSKGPCHVCSRASRGFGMKRNYEFTGHRYTWYCSMECQNMIDPSQDEVNAVLSGGRSAGEYLESIGKFSLNELSAEEWTQFCLCLVGGYCEAMKSDEPPF